MKISYVITSLCALNLYSITYASTLTEENKNITPLHNTNAAPAPLEDSQVNSVHSSGWGLTSYIGKTYTNTAFYFSDPEIEKKKFPHIYVSHLLNYMDRIKQDTLENYSFSYLTGSKENAPDYYKGSARIFDIRYGIIQHKFLSFEQGFDPNVTYMEPLETITFRNFINGWINFANDSIFHKGIPHKNSDGRTQCEYIAFDKNGMEYIRFQVERTPVKK